MAKLLQLDRAIYGCSCGQWAPLCQLYFDRHCCKMRCDGCVTHEIHSCFCSHCLETMPAAEARTNRNRCRTCLECPVCRSTLILRATPLLPPEHERHQQQTHVSADGQATPVRLGQMPMNKAYYLFCSGCFWTSRAAGIPDQTHGATTGWPTAKSKCEKDLTDAMDYFRKLAAIEKTDKDRQKLIKRRAHPIYYSEKFGLSQLYARKHLAGNEWKQQELSEDCGIEPSDDVPPLPEEFLTESIDLAKVSTLKQRFQQPIGQPRDVMQLLPMHKPVIIRRSLRCTQCEHNLCKSEYSPSSIQFKIQTFAILHAPEIRMAAEPKLEPGKETEFVLTIQNLSASLMHISLLPAPEDSDSEKFAKMILPTNEFALPNRDETAELDDSGDAKSLAKLYNDDEETVVFRKRHKTLFKVHVQPSENVGKSQWARLVVRYDYVFTALAATGLDMGTPEVQWYEQPVRLKLN